MRAILAAAAIFLWLAHPARATEWLICSGGEDVEIRVLLGAMQVIAVDSIEIEVKGKKWSTRGGDGVTLITKGQAFETAEQIWIDATDEKMDAIVARLRLFKANEGDAVVSGGTLQMPGIGAWAVSCEGP